MANILTEEESTSVIVAAYRSRQPICVYGPSGCGKSRLINLAWSRCNPTLSELNESPISVNIDDSMDAKSIVGSYISSTTELGQFDWVDGLLTDVIRNGRWLVLEDVDKIHPDILSILPRHGENTFIVSETNESVPIHPNFGLFGTAGLVARKLDLPSNWLEIECHPPRDLHVFFSAAFPSPVRVLMINTYSALLSSGVRKFGLHDLIRVIVRVEAKLDSLLLKPNSTFITDFQKIKIATEFVHLFAAHVDSGSRGDLVQIISTEMECVCPTDLSPIFSISLENQILFGDTVCSLGRLVQSVPPCSFTLTSVHLQILEKMVAALNHSSETCLLVGDTGTGKTSVVQWLASMLGAKLTVFNFSDQTESADLIGGLKPVGNLRELVEKTDLLLKEQNKLDSTKPVSEYLWKKFEQGDTSAVLKGIEKCAVRLDWQNLLAETRQFGKIFQFVPGPLIKALVNGEWLLLDELNLAPAEVLMVLTNVLDKQKDVQIFDQKISVHPNFKLFAAMNPPQFGRGKKSLPLSVRSRMTEIFFDEVSNRSDLVQIVQNMMEQFLTPSTLAEIVPKIVDIYQALAHLGLSNLEGSPPVFSLRSLSRALQFAQRLLRSPMRATGAQAGAGVAELVDGMKVAFTSSIDARSEEIVLKLIEKKFPTTARSSPPQLARDGWTLIAGHYIANGDHPIAMESGTTFLSTPSVIRNLKKFAICLAGGRIDRPPILCEGPTGAGKTSIITHVANLTGHKLIRINNHEHTDLQDYFGQYVSSGSGLVFQEGPLVLAVRHGWWVLLDELNLAPSEVLEALNRLLDDNRELVVPETNLTIRAHPDFVLFASQNPVTLEYAGRKTLSRAFRNRFVEIQIDELPSEELGTILAAKCKLADSTANRLLATYLELSRVRRLDGVLSGRDSALITVRDLLRWGNRAPTTREEIALEGYLVLAERLRTEDQKKFVLNVLEEKIGVKNLPKIIDAFYQLQAENVYANVASSLVKTPLLNRMVALISRALEAGESVLLVGETGTGKTSAVQLVAEKLVIVNCHQHLESGDLIGAVAPIGSQLVWEDGPLTAACKVGAAFLLDEINLADNSVIERLNSLLDVDYRALVLAEKQTAETVVAHENFRLLCTMNPGNDFGKKELSAALRNRFTEIWVPALDFDEQISSTGFQLVHSLVNSDESVAHAICGTIAFAQRNVPILHISPRDAILWCQTFMLWKQTMPATTALCHGASMVLLDPLESTSPEFGIILEYLKINLNYHQNFALDKTFSPPETFDTGSFSLDSATSVLNFGRLLRGISTNRPILCEGPPGGGKSSVVIAVAKYCGVELVRINLSDQTELADILGQFIPCEGGTFRWQDGILVEAILKGAWVLLDELNLAPQPVLEGLNSLLDHRKQIFVNNRTIECPSNFRLFATQNEAKKGDGRKSLPKSFLSRFNRVRIEAMTMEDLKCIVRNDEVFQTVEEVANKFKANFNLRDIFRVIECGKNNSEISYLVLASRFGPHLFGWVDPAPYFSYIPAGPVDLLACQASAVAAVALGLSAGCHIVLSGPRGSGKKSVARLVANHSLVIISLHSQMDTSDLIGQYVQRKKNFIWVDSPLVTAVRDGATVLLLNAHCCPPAILDRLNALMEQNGTLVIPEKGTAEIVIPHASFRLILSTERPQLLSQAIRNRCLEVALGDQCNWMDKVRVAVAAQETFDQRSHIIASQCATLREVFQATQLAKFLPLELSLRFVNSATPVSASVFNRLPSISLFDRPCALIDRQWAVVAKDNLGTVSWFLQSGLSMGDLTVRLAKLNLFESVDAPSSRLAVKNCLAGKYSSNTFPAYLHGESLGSNFLDKIESSHKTCFDWLLEFPTPVTGLFFGGFYRQQSADLFATLCELMKCDNTRLDVVAELFASCVACASSVDSDSAEARILHSVQQLLIRDSSLNDEPDDVGEIISDLARYCCVTDLSVLNTLGVKICESDLILAGVELAAQWTEIDANTMHNEQLLSKLVPLSTLSPLVSPAVLLHRLIAASRLAPCGHISRILAAFSELQTVLSLNSFSIPLAPFGTSFALPPFDVHYEKQRALKALVLEIDATETEGALFDDICESVSCGINGTMAREWTEVLKQCQSDLLASRVYLRPDDGYLQLKYLIEQVLENIENSTSQTVICDTIASFVQSALKNYKMFLDIVRPVCLNLLLVWHHNWAALGSAVATKHIVPVTMRTAKLADLVYIASIEANLGNVFQQKTLCHSIALHVAEMDVAEAKDEDDEEQVIVHAGVEISLSSLVTDNNKANADAAVEQLRRELFPDTCQFARQLATEDDDIEQQQTDIVRDTPDAWDELAIALVACEGIDLEEFLVAYTERQMETIEGGLGPELLALNRLRLRAATKDLQSRQMAPATDLEVLSTVENANIEMKIRLFDFIRNRKNLMIDFYAEYGGEALALLSVPFQNILQLLLNLQKTVFEIADHPDLLAAILVAKKALTLPSVSSAVCALQTAEYVLTVVQKIQSSVPAKYIDESTFGAAIPQLTQIIARLRASEVAGWRSLRIVRESIIAKSAAGKWFLHLWRAAHQAEGETLFDLALAWLRNSGIGQFQFRLSLLQKVVTLAKHNQLVSYRALGHSAALAAQWSSSINSRIQVCRIELDKSVSACIKVIQYRLGGRHYSQDLFRKDTKSSHVQLASALKRFEEQIAERVELHVAGSANVQPANAQLCQSIAECIETIKSSSQEKSAKSLKNRLLADLTSETKDFLNVSSGLLTFSPILVSDLLIAPLDPNPLLSRLISRCMYLTGLPLVCQNDDVRPVVIQQWRSLAAHAISRLSLHLQAQQTDAMTQTVAGWKSRANAIMTNSDVLTEIIAWIDAAKLDIAQHSVIDIDRSKMFATDFKSVSLSPDLTQQVLSHSLSVMYVTREEIHETVPNLLRFLVSEFYSDTTVTNLLSAAQPRFALTANRGLELARLAETSIVDELKKDDSAAITAKDEKLIEIDECLSIIDFAVFLSEEGLCTKQETEEAPKEGATEWTDGTGLGDGEGVNDKSAEIEDAAQFDTDRAEKKEDSEQNENAGEDGIDANADQGMNEDDVQEKDMKDQEDSNEETEMGNVDLDNGGQIDNDGAAPSEETDEKDDQDDEVEVKNQAANETSEEDVRANEKPTGDKPDADAQEGEEQTGENGSDDSEEGEEEEAGEKHEGFVDKHDDEEMGDEQEFNLQDEMDDDALDEPDATDEPEDDAMDETEEDAMDETEGDAMDAEPDGGKSDEMEEQEEDGADQTLTGTDASNGGNDQTASKSPDKSNGESMSEQTNFDSTGAELSNQQKSTAENRRTAPSPLDPNQSEALDEWLKEIREIVKHQSDAPQECSKGETGQMDETSAKKAVAKAAQGGSQDKMEDQEMSDEISEELSDQQMAINEDECTFGEDKEDDERVDEKNEKKNLAEKEKLESKSLLPRDAKNTAESTIVNQEDAPVEEAVPVVEELVVEENLDLKATNLSIDLAEKLMAVLEPTKRGRLEGFFKTGKRISMRRVLGWIASDYRKNKFWLRRTRPSHRDYSVMICLDNTLSMQANGVGAMSLICVAALSQSLSILQVGKVGVVSFGTNVREIHALDDPAFSTVAELTESFKFNEESSSSFSDAFPAVVQQCSEAFTHTNEGALALIITDGRFDKEKVRPFVQNLIAMGHVPVLIVMDANKEESILAVTSVSFEEDSLKKRKIVRKPFLSQSDCPFPFYAVIQEPSQLPPTLADIIRQWIETSRM